MHNNNYNSKNSFPHDGEHGINCTGYGCDCDEHNYGGYHPRKSSISPGVWVTISLISFIIILISVMLK